ncbi:hypothetical protein CDL12_04882 [Handroanthus impetiginosus]|uniref:Uncharacterized protein n=1 Tax=Handroanthus impetiginosus TaxID=429701 RepID=A0A2G9HY15_9LAMI|nr:hypothetical protein CDL12_04882 [Handroanthus impetiginosus]
MIRHSGLPNTSNCSSNRPSMSQKRQLARIPIMICLPSNFLITPPAQEFSHFIKLQEGVWRSRICSLQILKRYLSYLMIGFLPHVVDFGEVTQNRKKNVLYIVSLTNAIRSLIRFY